MTAATREEGAMAEGKQQQGRRRRWPWVILGFFLLLLGVVGGAWRFGPEYLRGLAEEKLSLLLQRQVSVGKIVFRPFDLDLAIEQVAIREPDGEGEFVGFSRFYLALDPSSLRQKALVIKACRLEQPRLHLVRMAENRYNFSDLLERASRKGTEPPPSKAAAPLLFALSNMEMVDGSFEFDDRPKKKKHALTNLSFTLPFLSNFPDLIEQEVTPAFSVVVNGTTLAVKGQSKPFAPDHETRVEVTLAEVNLVDYLPYLPAKLNFTLHSGRLAGQLALSFAAKTGKPTFLQADGGLTLSDFAVVDQEQRNFFSFAKLAVELHPSELLEGKIKLGRVALTTPNFEFERLSAGGIYPLTLLTPPSAGESGAAAASPPPQPNKDESQLQLTADELAINGASVRFADQTTTPAFKTVIAPVDFHARNFSLRPGAETIFNLKLAGAGGEKVESEGKVVLEPLAVSGQLVGEGIDLVRYAPYYQDLFAGSVTSGRLRLNGNYSHAAAKEGAVSTISNLGVELSALALREQKEGEFLALPLLRVSGGRADLGAQTFGAEELLLREGKVTVRMAKNGHLNLDDFVKSVPPPPPEKKKNPPPRSGKAAPARVAQAKSKPAPSWQGQVGTVVMQNWSVTMQDRQLSPPVTTALSGLTVKASRLTTDLKKPIPLSVDARLNKSGKIAAKGEVTPEPLSAKMAFDLQTLALRPFMPYVAEQINCTLSGGEVGVKGEADFRIRKDKTPLFLFKGRGEVNHIRVAQGDQELLRWEELGLKNIDLISAPFQLSIEEIALRDFWAKVTISADRKLNFASLRKEGKVTGTGATAAAQPAAKEEPAVSVKKMVLSAGRVEFLDQSIAPSFSSDMSEINGWVSGLDTKSAEPAQVELQAKHDDSAPLRISGTIRPRPDNFYAQISLGLTGVDLTRMTPYTAKYLGRTTDKGKLSLDLSYLIDRSQLTSENKALLDQFTLGSTVESEEATKLPIGLALALLTNRQGQINLDLPVSGSLDDPQFSLGRIIWKMVVNLISKAITSPLSLLGSLIPHGSPDLQFVSFPPGSHALPTEESKKLETMGKILEERPALKVDLTGYAQADADGKALAEQGFQQLLQKGKRKELAIEGGSGGAPEGVVVGPEEYEKYLKIAYKSAPIERPKNALGFEKSLPPAEMEQLLRQTIKIKEDDLQILASQRASAVKEFLLQQGQIDQVRIFLVAPKVATESEGERPGGRVELAIK